METSYCSRCYRENVLSVFSWDSTEQINPYPLIRTYGNKAIVAEIIVSVDSKKYDFEIEEIVDIDDHWQRFYWLDRDDKHETRCWNK